MLGVVVVLVFGFSGEELRSTSEESCDDLTLDFPSSLMVLNGVMGGDGGGLCLSSKLISDRVFRLSTVARSTGDDIFLKFNFCAIIFSLMIRLDY